VIFLENIKAKEAFEKNLTVKMKKFEKTLKNENKKDV
jgi:hypothetical protein